MVSRFLSKPLTREPHEQDISARSPVHHDLPPRQSLDSTRLPLPRASRSDFLPRRVPPTEEEAFEDVGLDEPGSPQQQQQHGNPGAKRRGIFSMFSEGQDASGGSPAVSRFLPGRRRNQAGQGSELRSMEGPPPEGSNADDETV